MNMVGLTVSKVELNQYLKKSEMEMEMNFEQVKQFNLTKFYFSNLVNIYYYINL